MNKKNNTDNQRQEYRLQNQATVFIEVKAESFDGQEPAEILISNSVDLSANGLQITADQPLKPNSIHQASIQLEPDESRFSLIVQVRWTRFNEDEQQHHIGLEVLDDSDSCIVSWKRSLSHRLLDNIDTNE